MKRFRMKKEKIVKPDGRWMYLYTFEEEPELPSPDRKDEPDARDGPAGADCGHNSSN